MDTTNGSHCNHQGKLEHYGDNAYEPEKKVVENKPSTTLGFPIAKQMGLKFFTTWLAKITQVAIEEVGEPPLFQPLEEFFPYMVLEFLGILPDFHDFQRQKDNTPCIMSDSLERFV